MENSFRIRGDGDGERGRWEVVADAFQPPLGIRSPVELKPKCSRFRSIKFPRLNGSYFRRKVASLEKADLVGPASSKIYSRRSAIACKLQLITGDFPVTSPATGLGSSGPADPQSINCTFVDPTRRIECTPG